ncbi:hypothetical protein CEP54_009257 [Fusarium duplospermum]|uniref:Uncharacterized protein n=1 Tax=Fusarium duplospermum TaxID=1325734 RepID=A0A428PRM1_9HYPO|nr:hypothetical protein CEP54_009257 [Fusarium duplospermum]
MWAKGPRSLGVVPPVNALASTKAIAESQLEIEQGDIGRPVTLRHHLIVVLSAGIKDTTAEKWEDPFYKDYERARENTIALNERLSKGVAMPHGVEADVFGLVKGTFEEVVAGLEAWILLKGRQEAPLRVSMAEGIWLLRCHPAQQDVIRRWGQAWRGGLSTLSK